MTLPDADDSWVWADVESTDRTDCMGLDDGTLAVHSLPTTAASSNFTVTADHTPSISPCIDSQDLQAEVENLKAQNKTLLRNICRLYLTAKREIASKEFDLKRLNAVLQNERAHKVPPTTIIAPGPLPVQSAHNQPRQPITHNNHHHNHSSINANSSRRGRRFSPYSPRAANRDVEMGSPARK